MFLPDYPQPWRESSRFLFDPSDLTPHESCCFILAVSHFTSSDEPMLFDTFSEQIEHLQLLQIPFQIVSDLDDFTFTSTDTICILSNETICHAFVYTEELRCHYDIDNLDYCELYHSETPGLIKGDANCYSASNNALNYENRAAGCKEVQVATLDKFCDIQFSQKQDKKMIESMSFARRTDGKYIFNVNWTVPDNFLRFNVGGSRITVANNPSEGCAFFSILNFIEPSSLKSWMSLIDLLVSADMKPGNDSSAHLWQTIQETKAYGRIPELVYKVMKGCSVTNHANYLPLNLLTALVVPGGLNIVKISPGEIPVFGQYGYFVSLNDTMVGHCLQYTTFKDFQKVKVLSLETVFGVLKQHFEHSIMDYKDQCIFKIEECEEEQRNLKRKIKTRAQQKTRQQRMYKNKIKAGIVQYQDIKLNAQKQQSAGKQKKLQLIKKMIEDHQSRFYFNIRNYVKQYAFGSVNFNNLPLTHESDMRLSLDLYHYKLLKQWFLPTIPKSQVQCLFYHDQLKSKSNVYTTATKYKLMTDYRIDSQIQQDFQRNLRNIDQLKGITLNGTLSEQKKQIEYSKKTKGKLHVKFNPKDLMANNASMMTSKEGKKLISNQSKLTVPYQFMDIQVENYTTSNINSNVAKQVHPELMALFSECNENPAKERGFRKPTMSVMQLSETKVDVSAQLQGQLHGDCLKYLSNFLSGVNKTDTKGNSFTGGHSFARYVNDYLHAQNLSQCASQVRESGQVSHVLHLGSKFGTMAPLSYDMFRKDISLIIGNFKRMSSQLRTQETEYYKTVRIGLQEQMSELATDNGHLFDYILFLNKQNFCNACLQVYLNFLNWFIQQSTDYHERLIANQVVRVPADQPVVQRPYNPGPLDKALFARERQPDDQGSLLATHLVQRQSHTLEFMESCMIIYCFEFPDENELLKTHIGKKCDPEFDEEIYNKVRLQAITDYNEESTPAEIIDNTQTRLARAGFDWSCCDDYDERNQFPCRHQQELPMVYVYHIRPAESSKSYDAQYYRQHIKQHYRAHDFHDKKMWSFRKRNVQQYIFQCKFEFFEQHFQDISHQEFGHLHPLTNVRGDRDLYNNLPDNEEEQLNNHIIMNDVHYYLPTYKIKLQASIYTTGTNHNPVQGSYMLAQGEGRVCVSQCDDNRLVAHMTQYSRGTTVAYSHKVVHIDEPAQVIPFGWYDAFRDVSLTSFWNDKRQLQYLVPAHLLFSQQQAFCTKWLDDFQESTKNTRSFQTLISQWKPDYTNKAKVFTYVRPSDALQVFSDDEIQYLSEPNRMEQLQFQLMKYGNKSRVFNIDLKKEKNIPKMTIIGRKSTFLTSISRGWLWKQDNYALDLFVREQKKRLVGFVEDFWDRLTRINNPLSLLPRTQQVQSLIETQDLQKILLNGQKGNYIKANSINMPESSLPIRSQAFLEQAALLNGLSISNKSIHLALDQIAPPKQPKFRNKAIGKNEISTEYFYTKEIIPQMLEEIGNPNPMVIHNLEEYNKYMLNPFKKLLEENPEPSRFCKKKNRYVVVTDKTQKGVPSGWQVISDGQKVNSYEFHAQNLQNQFAAQHRQMSGRLTPDPAYIECFKQVAAEYTQHVVEQVKKSQAVADFLDNFCLYDSLNRTEWSDSKIKMYQKNFLRQYSDVNKVDFCGSIIQHVKKGEVHMMNDKDTGQMRNVCEDDLKDDFLSKVDPRPRIYGAMSSNKSGITGAFQQLPIQVLKEVNKSFIHGLGHDALIERIRDIAPQLFDMKPKNAQYDEVFEVDDDVSECDSTDEDELAEDQVQQESNEDQRNSKIRKRLNKKNFGSDPFFMVKRVRNLIQISIDGSAWDSTQMRILQEHAERNFILALEDQFKQLAHNKYNTKHFGQNNWENLWDNLKNSWNYRYSYNFMNVPAVHAPIWPPEVTQKFKDDFPHHYTQSNCEPWNDYVFTKTCGTTLSGRDLETTFGNTLRNLLYFYTYMRMHGISHKAWLDDRFAPLAAGDDLSILVGNEQLAGLIKDAVAKSTSNVKSSDVPIGLGQCVKPDAFVVGPISTMQFCSKWFYSPDETVENLDYCRDMNKIMCTKMFYQGQNTVLRDNPWMHSLAIYRGLQSEQISPLLEDMFLLRVQDYSMDIPSEIQEEMFRNTDYVRYALKTSTPYNMKDEVHRKLGIGLIDLFRLALKNEYKLNGCGEEQIIQSKINYFNQINERNQMQAKQNKNRKSKDTNSQMLSDLSEILQDQRRHLADNKPITQQEVDRLNLKSLEDRFTSFEQAVIEEKGKLKDSDIKTIIQKLEQKDEQYVNAVKEMKELMQPLRGMSRSSAIGRGVELQTWSELQEMQRENKLTFPNMVIQRKVEQGLIPVEAGTGSGADLRTLINILEAEGVDAKQYEDDLPTFRAILMLNDWRSIAKELGANMFSYAKKNLTKDIVGKALHAISPDVYSAVKTFSKELPKYIDYGADSGIWIGDQSSRTGEMDKKFTAPGFNQFSQAIPRNLVGSESMTAVDYNFLATFIAPQSFQFREPQDYPLKTALIHSTQILQVTTNGQGDALIYLNPDLPTRAAGPIGDHQYTQGNPLAPTSKSDVSNFWIFDASQLVTNNANLATGTFESVEEVTAFRSGPLTEVAPQIRQYKTTGFSVSIKPIASDLNNSGTVHFGYFPRSGVNALLNGQSGSAGNVYAPGYAVTQLGTNAIDNAPYHQQGNFKVGYRFNHIPHPQKYPQNETVYGQKGKLDELYVIALSGCEPNSVVGSLEVSYVYEYLPVFSSQLMAVRNYPQLGARSGDFASNMIQKYPAIMSMTEEDAFRLASRIFRAKDNTAQGNEAILEEYFTRNH